MRILKRILKEEGGRCSAATQCHSKRGAEVTARFLGSYNYSTAITSPLFTSCPTIPPF